VTTWAYLLQTVGVGAVSFLLGYLAGRAARDVHRIAQTVTTQEEVATGMRTSKSRASGSRGHVTQFAIAAVVVLLGVLTVVQGLIQSSATRRISDCNAAFANALADAIDARSASNQSAQDALDELMTTIGRLAATPPANEAEAAQRREESRKAVTDYVTKRAEVKALQQKNPYPPPPRESCPH
jgi:hypothetical protein